MEKIITFVQKHKLIIFLIVGLILTIILSVSQPTTPKGFLLLNFTSPSSPTITSLRSTFPVEFTFNEPLKPESIAYTITPSIQSKINLINKNTTIQIHAFAGWDFNIPYTVTINQNLTSVTGKTLAVPIVLRFTLLPPQNLKLPDESSI